MVKVVKDIGGVLMRAWKQSLADDIGSFSAALAYYGLFSLAPLFIVVTALGGFLYSGDVVKGEILFYADRYLGANTAGYFSKFFEFSLFNESYLLPAAVGVVVLVWSSTNLFVYLQHIFEGVFKYGDADHRRLHTVAHRRFFSVMFLIVATVFLFALAAVNAVISVLSALSVSVLGTSFSVYTIEFINFFAALVIISSLFGTLYHTLSHGKLSWKMAYGGSTIAALLFTISNFFVTIYFKTSNMTHLYGIAGSVIVTLLWIHYVSAIFFYGAEVARSMKGRNVAL